MPDTASGTAEDILHQVSGRDVGGLPLDLHLPFPGVDEELPDGRVVGAGRHLEGVSSRVDKYVGVDRRYQRRHHAHAQRLQLEAQDLGELLDCGFGGAVHACAGQ